MPDGTNALAADAPHDSYAGSRFKHDRVFVEEMKAVRPSHGGVIDPAPDTSHGLVGLALSGGGIRSASFALGVVQAFNENRMFKEVDYLSTVSGGGYTGACISALLAQGKELPFSHQTGLIEHTAFRHLRDHSNYLAPGKTGRFFRIPTLVFQGLLRNALVLLPLVLLAVVVVMGISGTSVRDALLWPDGASTQWNYWPAVIAAVVLLFWIILIAPLASRLLIESVQERMRSRSFSGARYRVVSAATRAFGALFGIRRPEQETPREIRDRILKRTTFVFLAFLAFAFLNLQPYAVYLITHVRYGLPIATIASGAGLAAIAMTLARRAAQVAVARFGDRLLIAGLAVLGPLTLWLLFLLFSSWAVSPPRFLFDATAWVESWLVPPETANDCAMLQGLSPPVACTEYLMASLFLYFLLAAGLFVLFVKVYDVNAASLHGFYRDRLSAAFLFSYADDQAYASVKSLPTFDQLKLSELSPGRPLHLINAAINIQDSRYRNMRGRNADFFVFSRRFTGGEYTGYQPTSEMERHDPHLDLGTAMAISGAAVAPNAGIQTNRALRFLMMVANVRLGYWLRNPLMLATFAGRGLGRRVKSFYFFDELFGRLSEKRDYIYVSDGGHIENLGVFELLRRRCKYIVVSDASADPDMDFGSLAQLIRLARIDLGVNIDLDVTDLRKAAGGVSRAHCALGTINYGKGQVGRLLYIKASVSGDENAYVSEYRARHPEFPHETTTDQFFDEAQFEAYRALGHHIAAGLFETRDSEERDEHLRRPEDESEGKVAVWFQKLSRWLHPRPADLDEFLDIQQGAAALDRRFADAAVAPYLSEVFGEFPELTPADPPASDAARKVLSLVRDQLYLIERAVLKLQLDDPRNRARAANRGLMNMFRRWSQTDLFRRAWAVCIADFTPDLQRFCRDALDLKRDAEWRRVSRASLNTYEQERYADRFPNTRIYLARLYIESALPAAGANAAPRLMQFDVAAAFVGRENGRDVLECLRIRDTYRGQGLTEELARKLRNTLGGAEPPAYCANTENPDLETALHLVLRRAGFVWQPPGPS